MEGHSGLNELFSEFFLICFIMSSSIRVTHFVFAWLMLIQVNQLTTGSCKNPYVFLTLATLAPMASVSQC